MMSNEPQVIRLCESAQTELAYPCMEDVPTPWPVALQTCRAWMAQNLGDTVEGIHLQDSAGNVIGHVYYGASERALIPYQVEEQVAVVYCEWIQRRYQGQGYARLLSDALIRHLDSEGYKGILVAATDDEQCMHHSHFVQRGFRLLQQAGPLRLAYYPLRQERVEVQPIELRIRPERRRPVEIIVFAGGTCAHEVATSSSALQVAREFGNRVVLKEIATTIENLRAYGAASGVYINGRRTLPGGASEEAIRQAIRDELEEI
jgi:predicted GNAT family acetyltransferase